MLSLNAENKPNENVRIAANIKQPHFSWKQAPPCHGPHNFAYDAVI
jgi:hypothetical protein